MKVMFMQGLKNILKGSLSNQILGDIGGFSYQGQNIYVKAVKCKFLFLLHPNSWPTGKQLPNQCKFAKVAWRKIDSELR